MTDMYRPRRASEIIDAAVQLYRHNARSMIAIGALVQIPALILRTITLAVFGTTPDGMPNNVLASATLSLVEGVFLLFASAALTVAASRAYHGEHLAVRESYATAATRLGSYVVAAVLAGILFVVGIVLLIIPGLYFLAKYGLSSTIAVLEARSGTSAMARAAKLSDDRKRHVLAAIAAAWLIYIAVLIGAGLLSTIIPTVSAYTVLGAIVTIFAFPLVPLALVVTYYDLRIRAEGYDIELLEGRAARAVPDGELAV